MLRSSTFWFGVAAGVGTVYAYHYWQAKKAAKGN